jgi:outer membrane protein assembly factor BamB
MFTRPTLVGLALLGAVVLSPPVARGAEPTATDWPQWRGPLRTGVGGSTGLVREWPEGGPKVLWKVENVGVGYSSLAVVDGRIFTQGDLGGVEHVLCLDATDGRRLWAVQPEPVRAALAERTAEQFAQHDENGDGVLDELEALAGLGWKFNDFDRPTEGLDAASTAARRVDLVFPHLDANGDGAIDAAEAKVLGDEFARIDQSDRNADAKGLAAARSREMFAAIDTDNDGRITKQESRRTVLDGPFNRADQRDPMTRRGDDVVTREELVEYLERFEGGKDGRISKDELRAVYAGRYAGRDGRISPEELQANFGGYRNGQGDGPRGTPTVDGNVLYAEGGNGDVTCLDVATGKTIWHVNLVEDFGGNRPGWGYSESPLVVEDRLIVTPGGKEGTVVALDKRTGELLWRSKELTQGAHYASAVVAEIGGIRQIVQFARESAFGLDLETGELLWQYDGANNGTANCTTPIVSGNAVFTSSAYGTGGGLARITTNGSQQQAEQVYFSKEMANHHGGIVKFGDHMYGFGNGGLICMDFATGEIAWRDRSVGKGSLAVADGLLFLLGEGHEVALATATPDGYEEQGRFKIESHGRPSWAHPVVAGGRFYVRNQGDLTCYDVSE